MSLLSSVAAGFLDVVDHEVQVGHVWSVEVNDSVVGGGEPDPVELPQHLSEKFRPGERRPLLRNGVQCDLRGLGQHLLGQVTGPQHGQVVAPGQGFYPTRPGPTRVPPGLDHATLDQVREGLDVGPAR